MIGVIVDRLETEAAVGFAGLELLKLVDGHGGAIFDPLIDRIDIGQASERAVRHWEPIRPAANVRICYDRDRLIDDLLRRLAPNRSATLHIDIMRPGDLDVLVGSDEPAAGSLKHIKEAVTAGLHDN